MNRYDEAIYKGLLPPEPETGEEPASAGESYYWDARAEGLSHELACKRAARYMRTATASAGQVSRFAS